MVKKPKEKANQPRSFLLDKKMSDALDEAATDRGLTFSGLIRHIVTGWLHFQGFHKKTLKATQAVLKERQR